MLAGHLGADLRAVVATRDGGIDLEAARVIAPELEERDAHALDLLSMYSGTTDLMVVGSRGLRGIRADRQPQRAAAGAHDALVDPGRPGRRRRPRLDGFAGHYFPICVRGRTHGIVTTFAIVSGVRACWLAKTSSSSSAWRPGRGPGSRWVEQLSPPRRSTTEDSLVTRVEAGRHGLATSAGFVAAGALPLVAYLLPLPDGWSFPIAVGVAAGALFAVGAARVLVMRRGLLRSGMEMLLVGSAAGAAAYAIGAIAAALS